ncbi:DEAD/DEAH box helicase [Clavibacter tessellarius]|uniref:DEAD/DEAH box helicase n=1 Tax=Clavibacter tessellarius TaxID=31965 RepID=UPI0039ECEAF5
MNTEGPSLAISFAAQVTSVRLIARPGLENALRRLAVGFQTSIQRSPSSIEVELDDLLTNLGVLGGWPYQTDGEVVWDAPLQALVVDSLHDSQTLTRQLESRAEPSAADVELLPDALGADWTGDLTVFQRRDIAKLLSLKHGANFSVPGAGKTRVGLAVFQSLRQTEGLERLLIVGPKSSYSAWQEENAECLQPPLVMEVADGTPANTTEALIVNYERLPNMVTSLSRWLTDRPSMIVLDEAHRMKLGADGAYGAACLSLGPRSRRRLILTGTPAPNGAKDLENLFGFVWPGTGRQSVIRAVNGGSLADASRALRPLFTRTTKRELDLPAVETTIRTIPLPPLHAEIYEALVGQFSARAAGHEGDFQALGRILVYMLMAATSPALLAVGASRYEPLEHRVPPLPVPERSSLFQLMHDLPAYEMSPKYQEVLAIVSENAARGRKTLVWSTFIRSIKTLERILGPFGPAVVHGGTPDRDEQIRRFKRDDDCMVLLSNPATLGEGISLHHECHDAVYVDRDFAAGRFLQSLDRIHRLGLPPGTATRITVLASERTVDEVVAARLAEKLAFMGGILDDPAVQQLADLDEEPPLGGGLDHGDLQALMGHLRAPAT